MAASNQRSMLYALIAKLAVSFVLLAYSSTSKAEYKVDVAYWCQAAGYKGVTRILLSNGNVFEQWVSNDDKADRILFVGNWKASKDSSFLVKQLGTDGNVIKFENMQIFLNGRFQKTSRDEERTKSSNSKEGLDFLVRKGAEGAPQGAAMSYGILMRCIEEESPSTTAKVKKAASDVIGSLGHTSQEREATAPRQSAVAQAGKGDRPSPESMLEDVCTGDEQHMFSVASRLKAKAIARYERGLRSSNAFCESMSRMARDRILKANAQRDPTASCFMWDSVLTSAFTDECS